MAAGGLFRLSIRPQLYALSLASAPFGLFAHTGVDAAALGFGALPLAPQGLAPLTPFRCGERGLPLWKVRTCTYRPYNVTFSQYILLKAFRFRLGYRNGMGLRKAIGYGSLRSPNAGGRMLCQSKRI